MNVRVNACIPLGDFLFTMRKGKVKHLHSVYAMSSIGSLSHQRTCWYAEEVDEGKSAFVFEFKRAVTVVTAEIVVYERKEPMK